MTELGIKTKYAIQSFTMSYSVCVCAEGGHTGTICSLCALLQSKTETLFSNKKFRNENHMLQSVGHALHCIAELLLNWGPLAPESCHTGVGHCTFSFVSGSSNE